MKNSPLGELPAFGASVTSSEGYLLALWVHECQRVFSDKMITLEDKSWIDSAIKELCKTNFTPDLVKQASKCITAPNFPVMSALLTAVLCVGCTHMLPSQTRSVEGLIILCILACDPLRVANLSTQCSNNFC